MDHTTARYLLLILIFDVYIPSPSCAPTYIVLFQDGYCHIDNVTMSAPIKGYVNVTSGDGNALKVAVIKHGPISVAIDAAHRTFSFYANGVYNDPKCGM